MKPILASKLINALGEPKKGLAGYVGGSIAEGMARKPQLDIVKAQKFVISDNLVKHAVEASMSKPSILLDMLQNGKPHFDNLWIEWNEDYRQEVLKEVIKDNPNLKSYEVNEFPHKVGYHINLIQDEIGDKYFLYTAYSQYEKAPDDLPQSKSGQFISAPMSMVIHNEDAPSYEDTIAKHEILQDVPNDWVVSDEKAMFFETFKQTFQLMAKWYSMDNLPKSIIKKLKNINQLELNENNIKHIINYNKSHEFNCYKEIAKRISMGQSASMHWIVAKDKFIAGYERDEMDYLLKHSLESLTGDARFIISLFGLLNADITSTEEVKPDSKLIHTQFGKRVPRNEYKLLHVDISGSKVKKKYKSKYTGIKQKQHHRRGHLRRYRNEDGSVKKVINIASYIAGDSKLGTIEKDYYFKKED